MIEWSADFIVRWPQRFQFFFEKFSRQHPTESGHCLDSVEQRRVNATVLVTVIVPRRDAIQRRVLVQQMCQLTEVTVVSIKWKQRLLERIKQDESKIK